MVSRYIAGWVSPRDLSRRASLNVFAAGLDYVARILVELVLTPLLVRGLGSYLYGAWRILWRWTGYVWATSGRSAQALQWAISNRQHSTDYDEKRRFVGGAIRIWWIFLPLMLAVGGVSVWAVPHLLETPAQYVGAVRLATALLVADAAAVTLLTIPRSALQGENLGYKRVGLSTLLVLAQGAFTGLAILLDTGIIGIAVANLIGTLLTGVLFWRVAKRHIPWFGVAKPSSETFKWLFRLSWWFTGWKVVTVLMTGGDVLVLGVFASVELAAVYSLTRFVPEALTSLMGMLQQGIAPGLGGIVGARDFPKVISVRKEILSLTWLVATVAGVTVLIWNQAFVGLWVGERFYAGHVAVLLIVVTVVQLVLLRYDAQIIDATLNVRTKVILGFISATVSLGIAVVLVGTFDGGIIGLCVGLIAGRTIQSIGYPLLVGRAIGAPLSGQLAGALRPGLVMAGLFTAALALGRIVEAGSWFSLALAAIGTALLCVPVALYLGVPASQRSRMGRRLRLVLRGAGE